MGGGISLGPTLLLSLYQILVYNKYSKICYSELTVLDERDRITGASHISGILERFGFSFDWAFQGVGDDDINVHAHF